MNIKLDGNGWGSAKTSDIAEILHSVHSVFAPCFGVSMNKNNLLVIHSDDGPVTYIPQKIILLSSKDRYWSQLAYQFAHEYCHFQINGAVPRQLRWFEESLCELASYFFLPRISKLWEVQPPYPNWKSYAHCFEDYVILDKQKAVPFDLNLSRDTQMQEYLTQNEYDRFKNAFVAISLESIFEDMPSLWSSVHFISHIPEHLTFEESIRYWRDLVPNDHRVQIEKIALIFSINL